MVGRNWLLTAIKLCRNLGGWNSKQQRVSKWLLCVSLPKQELGDSDFQRVECTYWNPISLQAHPTCPCPAVLALPGERCIEAQLRKRQRLQPSSRVHYWMSWWAPVLMSCLQRWSSFYNLAAVWVIYSSSREGTLMRSRYVPCGLWTCLGYWRNQAFWELVLGLLPFNKLWFSQAVYASTCVCCLWAPQYLAWSQFIHCGSTSYPISTVDLSRSVVYRSKLWGSRVNFCG